MYKTFDFEWLCVNYNLDVVHTEMTFLIHVMHFSLYKCHRFEWYCRNSSRELINIYRADCGFRYKSNPTFSKNHSFSGQIHCEFISQGLLLAVLTFALSGIMVWCPIAKCSVRSSTNQNLIRHVKRAHNLKVCDMIILLFY